MSIRSAIYDLLNDTDTAVYPLVAPQETTGTYTVYKIRRSPEREQDGVFTEFVDLTLDIYGTLENCITKSGQFYTALEGASGTYDGESLRVCNWMGEDGDYIPELDKYNITMEFELKFDK